MPPPAPRLCLCAAPHGDSVLSVAFSLHSPLLLASGGEDCALLLHDLRICSSPSATASTPSSNNTSVVAAAGRSLFADPVAALAWQGDHVLYCGSGNRVYRLDTRKLGGNGSGSGSRSGDNNHASSSSPSPSPSRSPSSSSPSVVVSVCDDEVSSLSASRDGRALAVADESGVVSLLDLSRAERVGAGGGGREGEEAGGVSPAASVAALPVADGQCLPSRRLPRAHASLATAVAFRPGRAGESLVSGGCDCSLARWDSCSGRLVRRWQAREIAGGGGGGGGGGDLGGERGGVQGEGIAGGGAAAATSRVFNPPFVHALAVPSASAAKPWSGCVAAALGDGSVAVLDCEARGETRLPRKEREKKKGKPSPSCPPLLSSPLPAFSGVLAVLSPEEGGHSAAATCVAFVAEGGGGGGGGAGGFSAPLVASGGDDGRLLFWRWAGSAAVEADDGGGEGQRWRRRQLPAAWEAALAPLRGGEDGGGGGGPVVAAAARDRRWKMQALAAPPSPSSHAASLVAAADTSRFVKVYRVE